jgi:acetylglutamate kinase
VSAPSSSSSAAASPPSACARARRVDGRVVVVHGAGPQITAEMERRGIEPSFVRGAA